jgi:hypothetical protein
MPPAPKRRLVGGAPTHTPCVDRRAAGANAIGAWQYDLPDDRLGGTKHHAMPPVAALPLPALASRPFQRYHRRLDRIEICAGYGREILHRKTAKGVVSEYMSAEQRCWQCDRSQR